MRTLVLIHGFLEDNSMWDKVSSDLGKVFKLVKLELPGHGDRAFNNERSLAEIAVNLKMELKEEHYWILGHSLGGYVGLELLNTDQRAKGLILLNSNFWIDSPLRKMNRLRSIEVVEENKGLFVRTAIPSLFTDEYRLDNENVVNKLVRSALDMKESVIIAATQWMLKRRDFSSTDLLESVYLIHGQLDNLIPTEVVKERSEQSLCRYEIVEKVGHMAPFEMEPNAFVSLLQSVLSKMT